MRTITKAAAFALPCIAAITFAVPAAAVTTIDVPVVSNGDGSYAADFSASVAKGAGSVIFNLIFPVSGTGGVTFTSTITARSGVQITGAELNGSDITYSGTVHPGNPSATTYTGGAAVSLATAGALPLEIFYNAISAGRISGNVTFAAAVPEPATWLLMIGGMGLVGGVMRRRSARVTKVTYAAA